MKVDEVPGFGIATVTEVDYEDEVFKPSSGSSDDNQLLIIIIIAAIGVVAILAVVGVWMYAKHGKFNVIMPFTILL